MVSRRTSIRNSQAGFTLIELLVVIGMAALFFTFTVLVGLDGYRGYSFRGERDSIITVLQTARSQAISNVCMGTGCDGGEPHGVAFQGGKYIIFQGPNYAGRNAAFDRPIDPRYAVDLSGSTMSEVTFYQLSGNANSAGTIKVSDNAGHSSDISINSEGRISWTN